MAETALPAESTSEFLDRAVHFCNDTLWGTLCATVIAKHHRHAQSAAAVNRAVRDLRYGSVAVNLWAASAYALNVCSWGAYPGHTDNDIQSGRGTVANTFMLRDPEKSVLRSPFRYRPRPAWFTGHTNAEPTLRALAHLWANPSPATLTRTRRGGTAPLSEDQPLRHKARSKPAEVPRPPSRKRAAPDFEPSARYGHRSTRHHRPTMPPRDEDQCAAQHPRRWSEGH